MNKRMLIFVVLAVGCQPPVAPTDDPQEPQPEAHDGAVVDPADRAILDAVLTDVLTNPSLATTRNFYGSGGTTVLYDPKRFPSGYVPSVPGYQFAVRPRRSEVAHDAPRALTVDLRWFRGRPMLPPGEDPFDSNKAYRDKHGDWQGVEVCVFNGGGGGKERIMTIGGCSVNYDVRADGARWLVSFSGFMDP